MSRNTEFKKLQKENDMLREKIDNLVDILEEKKRVEVIHLINELVENELLQEELCE